MRAPARPLALLLLALGAGACTDPTGADPAARRRPAARGANLLDEARPAFVVTTAADAVDALPGDGECATALEGAPCSLRAAVQEANALIGPDSITLPAGTYPLTIPNPTYGPSGAESGGLEITDALTIAGAGVAATTVDCAGPPAGIPAFMAACGPIGGEMFVVRAAPVTIADVTLARTNPSTSLIDALGALRVDAGASLLVRDAAVRGQRTYSGGAGILNHGTLALDRVTVADNRASGVGGGLVNSGTATIVASTFSGNRGDLGGAAIASGGTLTLTNSTLSDNRTDGDVLPGDPSAALSNFGTATLNGVTVAGNVTGNGFSPPSDIVPLGFAAGIWNAPGGAAVLRMSNTIVAGNTITYLGYLSPTTIDYLSAPADCRGTLTSLGYNIIGSTDGCAVTGVPAGNLTGVDPLLGPLADNGGPTATRALLPGSPAIDAGHPARSEHAPRACRSTDQRGFPRVGRCDIGAYEAQR